MLVIFEQIYTSCAELWQCRRGGNIIEDFIYLHYGYTEKAIYE